MKVKGEEAWRYDSRCALCKGIISASEDVYVVGQHVFHENCLEKILEKPKHSFEEILTYLPLDTHEELKKLYEEKQRLPPRGTGLERGTARKGEERGRGKPLSEVERALRHREVHGESSQLETQSEPEERVLTREERRKLWDLARRLVDEALREVGHRYPSEMRVDGLGPEYGKFLLALRERLLKLVKEPKRLELRVEVYGKGYGDTHVFIDGEYLYTWRPEFDTIKSSFWGWVKRVYNLLKTLAEEELLKEEVLKG